MHADKEPIVKIRKALSLGDTETKSANKAYYNYFMRLLPDETGPLRIK